MKNKYNTENLKKLANRHYKLNYSKETQDELICISPEGTVRRYNTNRITGYSTLQTIMDNLKLNYGSSAIRAKHFVNVATGKTLQEEMDTALAEIPVVKTKPVENRTPVETRLNDANVSYVNRRDFEAVYKMLHTEYRGSCARTFKSMKSYFRTFVKDSASAESRLNGILGALIICGLVVRDNYTYRWVD